tara:strand:+ start:165 stop:494 length:330 start_codon:yes stop_codon:yes gene_type:complete
MNRRSFIGKILSSEANTVDKLPFEIRMCDSLMHYYCGCPNDVMLNLPILRITVYDEQNYVYVGKPVSPEEEWILRTTFELYYKKNLDDPFVHKKYFLVSLLMNTKNKKT